MGDGGVNGKCCSGVDGEEGDGRHNVQLRGSKAGMRRRHR